jgi:hypothetical protein
MFGILLGCCITLIAFVVYFKERTNHDPDREFILMEMLADIKDTKWARLYTFMLLARRTIFILVIIFLIAEINRTVIYSFLALIQLFYFLFIVSLHWLTYLDHHTPIR